MREKHMNNEAIPDPVPRTTGDQRIPVTLLTGFLGAGKTTLLNHLLKHPDMAGAAVLVNEFGEIAVDHHLIDQVDETMIVLDSGCICCNVQGDLVKALKNLSQRSSRREIPPVSRVVIETTGLADPVPVIYTLTQERFVAARYQCDGVITAVDATHALGQLENHREAVRQVAMADRLLITKCDLADPALRTALDEQLHALNPGAARVDVQHGRVSSYVLFGCGIYTTAGKSPDVAAWLGEEQLGAMRVSKVNHGMPLAWRRKEASPTLSHAHHAQRHDAGVRSFIVEFDDPVPWHGFSVAMGHVLQAHGAKILRVKGLMNVAGDPLPRVIHCVQEVAYPTISLAKWPEQKPFADRRGRLVFIARDLHRAEVDAITFALLNLSRDPAPAAARRASFVLPTRCWLAHGMTRGSSSEIELDGWVVQAKHLRER
jgi:G3E family GTPase